MKFECACGALLHDGGDALPHKAWFVADQDWSDFLEGAAGGSAPELTRWMYQCAACGRLLVYDRENRLLSFKPDSEGGAGLLASTLGDRYRVALSAQWEDWKTPPEGRVFWESAGSRPGGLEVFKDRAALEARYRALLEQLRCEGRLRCASLRAGQAVLHSWPEPDRP